MNIQNDKQKIIELFKKYNVEWFLNIQVSDSKELEYSPLYDEISLDESENISTSIVIIKDNKKAKFTIDSYSLEKIEFSIKDMLNVIEYAEQDKDIVLPTIEDNTSKDFSNHNLDKIDFDFLKQEFEKFKSYNFNEKITIETFQIWYKKSIHYFINSLWSFKSQTDNISFYYFELFAQNWEKREVDYKYKSLKDFPYVSNNEVKEKEEELLNKVSDISGSINPWKYTITLDKDVVIDFLDIILSNIWAESIREGISLFSKYNIWDKIFWENFTLMNNPYLEGYTWTMLFDWEWITLRKVVLFEKWVFKSKFYDYKNALKEWLENLWNSTVSNIELVANWDENYLMGSSFLFTNLMAFHTVDSTTWKFSLNWEGYLLENWEKKWFVKNISLSGNVLSLFSSIKSIWNDFKTWWNFKVPSITFENQEIS